MHKKTPLVYSCSGCSNVAQMANDIALWLNKQDKAEMSCIAGIGGGVKALLHKAKNRQRIVLDWCPLQCAKSCMENQELNIDLHIDLSDFGLKKAYNTQFSEEEKLRVINDFILKKIDQLSL